MEVPSFASYISFYGESGLRYFPLNYGTKEPAVSQGFKSSDEEIKERIEHLGKYNLALACGEASGNLCVLDFEFEKDAWAIFPKTILQSTFCVKSAHGGVHIYFRTIDKCPRRQTKLCSPEHSFDICGEGGYVAAAPSIIDHSLCDPKKENCPHFGISSYETISSTKQIQLIKGLDESIRTRCSQLGWKIRQGYQGEDIGSFQEIFQQALLTDNELSSLYSGDLLSNKSRSEAEFRLCSKLVSMGFPDQEIFRIMDASKIGKWQEKEDSYRFRTLSRARQFKAQSSLTKTEQKTPEVVNPLAELERQVRAEPSSKNLCSLIMKMHHFSTFKDTREIFVYSNGIYEANGEAIIQSLVDQLTNGRSKIKERNEVVDLVRIKSFRERKEFNQYSELIPLENGIYDLVHDLFIEHDPKYLFTSKLSVKYDPDAGCHNFWSYLKDCQPDPQIRKQLLESMAFCLDRRPIRRKSYMFLGAEGTGKTTFLNVLRKLLGSENCAAEALQALSGEDKFATSMLYNKMANIYADISDVEIETTGSYKLSTGSDMVPAQFKHKPKFYFVPFAKFFFSANQLPKVSDDADLAFFDRWFIIYWNIKFVNEPKHFEKYEEVIEKRRIANIEERISTPEELSGLLNLLLYNLKQIRLRGHLLAEPSAQQIQAIWKDKSDFNFQFVKAELIEDPKAITPKNIIHESYQRWCDIKSIAADSETALNSAIRGHFKERVREVNSRLGRFRQVKSWQGIALKQVKVSKSPSGLESFSSGTDVTDSGNILGSISVQGKKVQKNGNIGSNNLSDYVLRKFSNWESLL